LMLKHSFLLIFYILTKRRAESKKGATFMAPFAR